MNSGKLLRVLLLAQSKEKLQALIEGLRDRIGSGASDEAITRYLNARLKSGKPLVRESVRRWTTGKSISKSNQERLACALGGSYEDIREYLYGPLTLESFWSRCDEKKSQPQPTEDSDSLYHQIKNLLNFLSVPHLIQLASDILQVVQRKGFLAFQSPPARDKTFKELLEDNAESILKTISAERLSVLKNGGDPLPGEVAKIARALKMKPIDVKHLMGEKLTNGN